MRSGFVNAPAVAHSVRPQPRPSIVQSSVPSPRPTRPKERHLVLGPFEGWLPLFLLAISLYCVTYAVMQAKWVEHSELLLWGPALGLVVGLIAAKLPGLPQSLVHLLACLIGGCFAIGVTSLAFQMSWPAVTFELRDAVLRGVMGGVLPASKLIFFFYLIFLCFFLGHFGSWLVYRAHLPWLVALVYSAIMLVNLNYAGGDDTLLIVALAGSQILLVARIYLMSQLTRWTSEGLYTNRSWMRSFITRGMSIAAGLMSVVVVLASLFPAMPQAKGGQTLWDTLGNTVDNFVNGRISIQDPGSLLSPFGSQSNFFGDQLMITGSVRLPSGNVLTYNDDSGPRYLEGFAYNTFDGRLWTSTVKDAKQYAANVNLPADSQRSDMEQITTTIKILVPPGGTRNYLFGPSQPVRFSVPVQVYHDGAAAAWVQTTPLQAGETYQVVSLLPVANPAVLMSVPTPARDSGRWGAARSALQNYDVYLQVPGNLSNNVRNTVLQWTGGGTTNDAYTALKQIEAKLSNPKEYTYSLDNPPIPDNTNVVDWLLQKRSGYCTYYASAMAMMGRLLGIPTRMINGFSQGHYDQQSKSWIVTGSDAHSWVQAYFPSIGWVNFDPTPGFAPGAKPANNSTSNPSANPTAPAAPSPTAAITPGAQPTTTQKNTQNQQKQQANGATGVAGWILPAAIVLLIGALLWFVIALLLRWWRRLYAGSPLISGLFWRLCMLASWVGLAPKNSQTPLEYGYMLSQHFPQQSRPLYQLTDLFVRERWGSPWQAPRHDEQQEVVRNWRDLSRTLIRALLFKRKRK